MKRKITSHLYLAVIHAASLTRQGHKRDDACRIAYPFDPEVVRPYLDDYLPGSYQKRNVHGLKAKTKFK